MLKLLLLVFGGLKFGKLLLTGAIFDIEKAYEFTNSDNVYTQDGRQKHTGIEFNATGKLFDKLTVVSGIAALAVVLATVYAAAALTSPVPRLVVLKIGSGPVPDFTQLKAELAERIRVDNMELTATDNTLVITVAWTQLSTGATNTTAVTVPTDSI